MYDDFFFTTCTMYVQSPWCTKIAITSLTYVHDETSYRGKTLYVITSFINNPVNITKKKTYHQCPFNSEHVVLKFRNFLIRDLYYKSFNLTFVSACKKHVCSQLPDYTILLIIEIMLTCS